ncbi:MAG: hypothetical protein AMJ79_05440 [Phycisphaerae bacterium SM23_30]|nr:MAG: hypothetical protein AMJ79_05440 [Phycisphaerae bacterium SM23_30]
MISFSWARSRKKLARLPSDATISTRTDSMQWVCLNRHHTSLFGYKAPDWTDLDHDDRAELIKTNPLRRVYRIRSQDYDLHAKLICPSSLKDRLKWYLRRCPSQIEFENLQIARARTVPVIMPVAWAQSPIKNEPLGILVTQTIKSAYSFEDLLWQDDKPGPQVIANALTAVAQAVGRLHCGGIFHRDLHPGNLLLAPPPEEVNDDIPIAYISDLQNIRIDSKGGHASADPFSRWRIANLGMLLAGMRKKISRSQQRHFAEKYIKTVQPHYRWSPQKIDDYFRQLLFWADIQAEKIARSRDRRSLKNSKYSQQINLGSGWYARVFLQEKHPKSLYPASRHQFTVDQWRSALSDPNSLLQPGRILKKGGQNTIIARNLTIAGVELPVVVKNTRLNQGWRKYWQSFRQSRALRHWYRAHTLINRDLPTPWPLAALEYYKGLFLQQSIYICSEIPYSCNLRELIKQDHLPRTHHSRNLLTEQIARLLAQLRLKGFRHRDCKATNIIVESPTRHNSLWNLYLVDLDGLRRRWINLSGARHEAIIRLAASCLKLANLLRSDYVRLFNRYVRYLKLPEAHNRFSRHDLWKSWAREANDKAHKISKRNRPKALKKGGLDEVTS